jgi:hypothetical protein
MQIVKGIALAAISLAEVDLVSHVSRRLRLSRKRTIRAR